jgi:hypothetical protein
MSETFDIVAYTSTIAPVSGEALDLSVLTARISHLLRRDDLDGEIAFWLNYSYQTLCDRVNFLELRTTVTYTLTQGTWQYDLPDDYMREDRAFFKSTVSGSPIWGRNVWPLPRDWYFDAELERRSNVGNQSQGMPMYYLIDGLQVLFYPVPLYTGDTIEFTYYKLPVQLVSDADEPEIQSRYRHYLIWLAYFWGQVFLEKEDIKKVAYWQDKFDQTIKDVKRIVDRRENKSRQVLAPITGTEGADKIYGGG